MEHLAVKIKSYRIAKRGHRGACLTIPQVWLDDVGAMPGDAINVLRTHDNRLILELAPRAGEVRR